LKATDRLTEAEPLTRRVLITFVHFSRAVGSSHPHLQAAVDNYAVLLQAMGRSHDEILATLREIAPELFRK
jgi:ABC-type transporter Mla subunit MlaD